MQGREKKVSDEEMLDFIKNFTLIKGYSPTVREICDGVGLTSTSSVHYRMKKFFESGDIIGNPGDARGYLHYNLTIKEV